MSDELADFITRQSIYAQNSAVGNIDADPEEGARALELSKQTGVDAQAIYGDVEGFEKQHKAALTQQLLRGNPILQDYVNSHPLASVVSNDDMGQLDKVTESISKLSGEERMNLFRGRIHDVLPDETTTPEPQRPSPEELMKKWEGKSVISTIATRDVGAYLNHYIQGIVDALSQSSQESSEKILDPNRPGVERTLAAGAAIPNALIATGMATLQPMQDAFQAIGDVLERGSGGRVWSQDVQTALMMPGIFGLGGKVGDLQFGKALKDHVEAVNLMKPYVVDGKLPPVGLHSNIDKALKSLAIEDVKNLDETVREAQKSATRDRASGLFEDLASRATDASIGISAEAVRKLYGDKVPQADDNLLGWVPGIQKQLEVAEQFGGDIEVPLAAWLARADPEVAKALKDDIRVRKDGMTVNETKPPERTGDETTLTKKAEPEEKPAPIDQLDAIRRPAGLDPVAAPRQIRLVRVLQGDTFGGTTHDFDLEDSSGKRVGGALVTVSSDGKSLNIESVSAGTRQGLPGFLGSRQVIGLLRQFQQEFPSAERIEGFRVSGARQQSEFVSIPLRPTEKQITDFLRQGNEPQSIRMNDGSVQKVQPLYTTTLGEVVSPLTAQVTPFGQKMLELAKDVPIHIIRSEDLEKIYPGASAIHVQDLDTNRRIFVRDDISNFGPQEVGETILHEGGHAATTAAITAFPELRTKLRSLMTATVKHLKANNPEGLKAIDYALTNEKEFIAEAMGRKSVRDVLEATPISRELANELHVPEAKSAWEVIKNVIKDLWGRLVGAKVPENVLQSLLSLNEEIGQRQREVLGRGWIKEQTADAAKAPEQLELPGLTRMEDREAFEKAAAIGMTVKQYRRYQELIAKRDQEDMDHFRAQAEKRERLRQTAEWKAEESRILGEVKTSLQGRPDIAADAMFREGSYLGDKLKGRPRLDSDKLSAEQKFGLPDDYHKSGGVNPDDAAAMFGYHSPDHMIQAIKDLHVERGELGPNEHLNKVAEGLTQERMKREFGNLEQNILEEAKDHVISPSQLDILHEEMVALASKYGDELSFSKSDIKAWVKKQFSEIPISMHDTDVYLAAAGRAGRGAEQALLDEDGREAFKFKQQQYVSMLMANETKAYEKARASFDKLAKRLARRELPGLPQDYVAHIRDQLLRAGLPIGRTVQTLAQDVDKAAGNLMQFAQRESETSQVPILLPDWMYDQGWKKKLDSMTAGEFSEYSKGIKQLYTIGTDAQKIIRGGEKIDQQEFMNEAKAQLEKQTLGFKSRPYNPSSGAQLRGQAAKIFYGGLIQAESIFHRWDLGDKAGFFLTNFMYPTARAVNDLDARIKVYSKKVEEAAKSIEGLKLNQRLPDLLRKVTDGEAVNMTIENALRIITDMGNPSNIDKFTRGWKVDPQQLQMWLQTNTTKEMWDFAQALGDVHEAMFKDLGDMIDSISGQTPDRIPLQPFVDPHGVQRRGWYSPMIYDQVELGRSRKLAGLPQIDPNDITGLTNTGYFKSTTATGAEIQRTGYAAPTDLTLDRLPQRMSQILYDTAMRPTIINLNKSFKDTEFLNAITRYSGVEIRELMKTWFRDLVGAGKGVSSEAERSLNDVGEFLRRNIVAQLVGWNLHTAGKHGLSALATSAAEVGVRNFARELVGLMHASPETMKNGWNYAHDMSEEVQRRDQHFIDSLGGQIESVKFQGQGLRSGVNNARNWMIEKGSIITSWADAVSTRAMWNAEFKTQMAKLAEEMPDKTPEEYLGIARDRADHVVRRAHGSTALSSRPGFMRSGSALTRSFVSLYGFFNQMLQRNYEAAWRTKYAAQNFKEGDKEKGWENLQRASVLVATSALWPALVEEMITPYTNSDHDSWGKWTGKMLLNGMSSTIPFVREFVHAWLNGWEVGGGIFDTGWRNVTSEFDDLHRGTKAMDADRGGKTIKDTVALVGGSLLGVPNEVGNVLKTGWDSIHRSKETPQGVKETARELTTGHAKAPK